MREVARAAGATFAPAWAIALIAASIVGAALTIILVDRKRAKEEQRKEEEARVERDKENQVMINRRSLCVFCAYIVFTVCDQNQKSDRISNAPQTPPRSVLL